VIRNSTGRSETLMGVNDQQNFSRRGKKGVRRDRVRKKETFPLPVTVRRGA